LVQKFQDWESDEDPDRLWCICRKPHGNKFMISCDGCKEWFHGKCVGITKKMGKDMEECKSGNSVFFVHVISGPAAP
jgi:hypothetical protein